MTFDRGERPAVRSVVLPSREEVRTIGREAYQGVHIERRACRE